MSLTQHDGLRICDSCREGYHDDCIVGYLWDGHDILDAPGGWAFLDAVYCECDCGRNGVLVDWQSPRSPLPSAQDPPTPEDGEYRSELRAWARAVGANEDIP